MLKEDHKNNNSGRKLKLPKLSIEMTSVMFSAMLYAIENKSQLMGAIPTLLAAPGDKKNIESVEFMIKKNLDQSINAVCLLSLTEKLINQENSVRATVSLIYIFYRIVFSQNGKELGKKEAHKLWEDVWSFAIHIPKVAKEIEGLKETNDLQFWRSEVQDFARRRWRTLKYEQMPRVKKETEDLQKRIAELLKTKSDY